jgi:hypothetical protein
MDLSMMTEQDKNLSDDEKKAKIRKRINVIEEDLIESYYNYDIAKELMKSDELSKDQYKFYSWQIYAHINILHHKMMRLVSEEIGCQCPKTQDDLVKDFWVKLDKHTESKNEKEKEQKQKEEEEEKFVKELEEEMASKVEEVKDVEYVVEVPKKTKQVAKKKKEKEKEQKEKEKEQKEKEKEQKEKEKVEEKVEEKTESTKIEPEKKTKRVAKKKKEKEKES